MPKQNPLFKNKYRIPSTRVPNYDYSQNGYYFVTICTKNKTCDFGSVFGQRIILSPAGYIAKKCWTDIPKHFPHIDIDVFAIMPNHVHGIVVINHGDAKNASECDVCNLNANGRTNAIPVSNNGAADRDECANATPVETYHGTSLQSVDDDQLLPGSMSSIAPKRGSLGNIVKMYKSAVTKKINYLERDEPFAWQMNYHERIIRDEFELHRIRKYIKNNPTKWIYEHYNGGKN